MIKVICTGELEGIGEGVNYLQPEIGSPYTVVGEEVDPEDNATMYSLAEFPPKDGHLFIFDSRAFSPISGITDQEIEEEYQEQEAASLDAEFARIVHEYENE
jgi:hypothetical protein